MSNIIDLISARNNRERREQDHFDNLVEESVSLDENLEHFSMQAVHEIVEVLEEDFDCDVMSNPKTILDILAIVEQIKGLAYRAMGEEHPMQTISQNMFESSVKNPERLLSYFMTGEAPKKDG